MNRPPFHRYGGLRRACCGVAFAVWLLVGGAAQAHDSWFAPSSEQGSARGARVLQFSTGNRYPVQEFNPTAASLVRSQCTDRNGATLALKPLREQAKWLELQAVSPARQRAPLLACWLELKPFELQMTPDKVQIYLDEIKATPAQRAAWAQLQARQLPWQESYRKFARIELAAAATATPAQRAAARQPAGLDLEMVVLGDGPIAVGQPLAFQVLRDGQPLAGFAVELISERSALGIWRETDANGVVRHSLPFAGRWLLRGTDLRQAPQPADSWVSRFVTLAIEAP